jgi:hypothetical protein
VRHDLMFVIMLVHRVQLFYDQQVKPQPSKPPTESTPTPPSPINQSTHNLQPAKINNCTQLAPKPASVVAPEDGRLNPDSCTGLRGNKVFVIVKLYLVGYVIVIHNDTRSTECQNSSVAVTRIRHDVFKQSLMSARSLSLFINNLFSNPRNPSMLIVDNPPPPPIYSNCSICNGPQFSHVQFFIHYRKSVIVSATPVILHRVCY